MSIIIAIAFLYVALDVAASIAVLASPKLARRLGTALLLRAMRQEYAAVESDDPNEAGVY